MQLARRRLLLGVAVFVVIVVSGGWPWDFVRTSFSRAFSAAANPVLELLPVPGGLTVSLEALPEGARRRPGDNVEADTHLVLRMPAGREGRLGVSLRRDVYLPLLIFVATILAAPLSLRGKGTCLAIGAPIVTLTGILALYWVVLYLLNHQPGASRAGWQAAWIDFLFERWLTPPGNRVITPLLLALALGIAVSRSTLVKRDALARRLLQR